MTDISFQRTLKQIHKAQDKIAPLIEGLEDEIPQQSMKDYFVKLQIVVKEDEDQENGTYESISGEKKEVELADIFDKLTEEGIVPTKLLVLGGAGVGKTTLMQYIAYKWGAGELWQDRFDHVYRVGLKTLLNDHWKDDYSKEELREDILKCLVHYNLVMRLNDGMDEPALKEMYWSADTERTLLLLDGYDEIAHLKNNNTPNKDYQRLEKKIFEHKNLIFTSRPNAIGKTMKTQFDKVLENTGLTKSGIDNYFSIYFRDDKKGKEAELRSFLTGNQVIWQICTVPVNIAMLCYIWSTSNSSEDLAQISTASGLYKNVIDRLGQRYFAKEWNDDDKTDKVTLEEALTNGEFTLDELRVLAHVAYKALTGGGINVAEEDRVETLIIRGAQDKGGEIDLTDQDGISVLSSINYLAKQKVIQDDQKKKVTVGKVCRYGLLKVEGTISSINNKKSDINAQRLSYSFLHLTFQEYLTALYLKEQLTSDHVSEKEKREMCQYLAEHRNEPRYLMMLKFLAGIITADQSVKAEYAVKVFWDAIVCNVDGVIELGIETKISLMIHLLGQAKINGKMDPRIPHKDQAFLLIDAVVLNDLFGWASQLKESDFMTDTIKEAIIHALTDDNLIWSQKKLTEIEAKSSSSLQAAIQKITKNKSGKEATESGQSSGTVTGLAVRMMNEVNLKLTTGERLTIMRRLKDIIMTHQNLSTSLSIQAMQEFKKRILESVLPDRESLEIIDMICSMILNNSVGSIHLRLVTQIVEASGKKDIAVKAIEKLDALLTHKQFLAMDMCKQIEHRMSISYYTVQIVNAANDKTLINVTFEKVMSNLTKSQEALDALDASSRENINTRDSGLAEPISKLLSSSNDTDFVAKTIEMFFSRAKQRDYKGLMATNESISGLVSHLKDKEMIAACVSQISHFLSSEESLTTQWCVLVVFNQLNKCAKDKAIALKIYGVIDHFANDKTISDESLKAWSLNILSEALEMTEDPEFIKKEMEKVFKLFESIQASFQKIAIAKIFRVVEIYKDKELAAKLMEYICTNDYSAPEKALIQLARTLENEKGVMLKFIEYLNRLLYQSDPDIKLGAVDLILMLFEEFKDKYETDKIIESLVSMFNDRDIKKGLMCSPIGMNDILQTKIIEHAMRLLDNDNAQIQCSSIDILRGLSLFKQLRDNKEKAAQVAQKLAKLLSVKDSNVKQQAIYGIDTMLGLVRNDELSAQVVQQHKIPSLLETLNSATPNLIKATVRMLIQKNDRESITRMIDKMIDSLSGQKDNDQKKCALDNMATALQMVKDKELAVKAIDAILKIIPSHLTAKDFNERQSRPLEETATRSANQIIKILEDQKLALKTIQHITLSDDLQAEFNYSLTYIGYDAIRIANDNQLTTKLLKEVFRPDQGSSMRYHLQELWNKGIGIIANFLVPLEQVLQYLQNEKLRATNDLIASFKSSFKQFIEAFATMEKLLKNPQNLTIEAINENLFDNTLKETTQTEINAILVTVKDDLRQNTSVEKLREILTSHLNHIGLFRKHELIEPILAVVGCIERDVTVQASQRIEFIEKARLILEFQIKHMDEQGLEWVHKSFDKLVALSQESKLLFRKLYHKLLEDEELTRLEEEVIIKFINQGLTTSITRNREISFEGKRYKIKSQNVTQLLDAIASAVIDQDRDPLALQYKVHKPIFPKKSEFGMKKASADVESVYSVINKTQELSSDQWILAELREEPQGTLLLLEKRSPIGDHMLYKIGQSNRGEHCLVRVDIEDDKKDLEEIFSKYVACKRFQGRTTSMPIDTGIRILSNEYQDFESVFGDKGTREYFQQELLGLGSTDRIDYMDRELSTKLTDYEKALSSKLTDKISPEDRSKIKEYFRAFVETFASAYTAAQVIDSGQVQLNTGSMETKVLATLASFVPFGGSGLSEVVSSVGDFLKSRDMIKNARAMKKLASDGTNLNQLVSETAMKIALHQKKQSEITKITDEDLEKISGKMMEKISKFISNLNVKIDELIYTKRFSTAAAKLGNNDANGLIEHWVNQKIQSSDTITIQNCFVELATEATAQTGTINSRKPEKEAVARSQTACCALF